MMKRRNLLSRGLFTILLVLPFGLFAQGYYMISGQGTSSDFNYLNDKNVDIILDGDTDNVYSPPQKIPFTWTFYGDTVTHYIASDNGYINFDTTHTNSKAGNKVLSDAGTPDNSIFAFWDNFILVSKKSNKPDQIRTWTYGPLGSRVHVIQWYDITLKALKDNARNLFTYFEIRLFETGGFDIVFSQFIGQNITRYSGTIGARKDSSLFSPISTTLSNNRRISTNKLSGENGDDIVYRFWNKVKYDIFGYRHFLPNYAASGDTVNITGIFRNFGDTITQYKFNYQVNDGPVQTQSKTNDTLAGNSDLGQIRTHTQPWIPQSSQINQNNLVKIWLSDLDGNMDKNAANDTLYANVFVNEGISAPKKVLLEEFTSANCQGCAHGKIVLNELEQKYQNFIHIAHHGGNGSDSMTIKESREIGARLGPNMLVCGGAGCFAFFPYAAVDRVKNPLSSQISLANLWPGQQTNLHTWENFLVSQGNKSAPIKLTIDAGRNDIYWDIPEINISAEIVDHVKIGDYRISAFLVEDPVVGQGQGYNQANLFAQISGHPFSDSADPMTNYKHRNVVRDVITATWGREFTIPDDPKKGESFKTQSPPPITLSPVYNVSNLKVVAFVHYYDRYDNNEMYVLNADEASLAYLGMEEKEKSIEEHFSVYPNPSHSITEVSFTLDELSHVSLDVLNTLGQKVKSVAGKKMTAGDQALYFNVRDLKSGMYLIRLTVDGEIYSKQLLVK